MPEDIIDNENKLPSGYRSVETTGKGRVLLGLDWIKEGTRVPLSLVTLDTGKKFYLGSAIASNHDLRAIADKLQSNESDSARTTFYAKIGEFFANGGCCRGVNRIECPRTAGKTIFGVKSRTDMRTYFIWDGKSEDGVPVVIRIGVCRKSQQPKLMSVISKF